MPSKEELDQVLKYDFETGEFRWRPRPLAMFKPGNSAKRPRSAEHSCNQWNSHFAGRPAASLKADGYYYINLNYHSMLAHRVAYKIMTGSDPVEIDHIDGNRSNNKWTNLKNGTRSDNLRNVRIKRNNTSGYHGVRFDKGQQKWIAMIQIGSFNSKEEAIAARKHAECMLGFHPNHGRPESAKDRDIRSVHNTKSNVHGVTWDAERECWQAWKHIGGKQTFLGRFAVKEDAIAARRAADEECDGREAATEDTNPAA
jgi:hypothetical protein